MMRTMKLTQFTDYSLRVLIYLATDPERRATIAEIARAFEVSESHLTKVVHHLSKCQYLSTVRGKGGGLGWGVHRQTSALATSCKARRVHPCPPSVSIRNVTPA